MANVPSLYWLTGASGVNPPSQDGSDQRTYYINDATDGTKGASAMPRCNSPQYDTGSVRHGRDYAG
ncbi:hypothetical protein [Haladaptatus caseinilyticus]|uniref:hypothetical protein n=1 Tax=Haladaptatus caseinilyticus TaxID=2993314 RepID=UPI00224A7235|nr:hypothetical protein [Haladaptatus caseinilyticus]